MTDALEAELDALFQLPAAEMVAARNALVSRLKKAGEREAAARVAALKRPAPAAWAINQIFFQQRELLEQALAEVAHVRELQATEGLDRQQLAAAVASQRVALQAVVDAALRNLAAAGLSNAGPNERRVFATVQGWLGGSGDEAPGRMTRELEPSGFESVGVLGIPAPLPAASGTSAAASGSASSPPSAAGAASASSPVRLSASVPPSAAGAAAASSSAIGSASGEASPLSAAGGPQRSVSVPRSAKLSLVPVASVEPAAPDPEELARRAREQAEARVFERKQAFEWAEGRLAEQRKKQAVAEQALERAKHEVEDAERALALRRAALGDRQSELSRRQQEADEADRACNAAQEALKEARAQLAKL